MITKPMLAARCTDVSKIKFPVLATPKIDGIRCLRINGYSVSRTFKRIPNKYIQQQMQGLPDGLDGELIINGEFQKTTSGVMSRDGEPDFKYCVFDNTLSPVGVGYTYQERLSALSLMFNRTITGETLRTTPIVPQLPVFCCNIPARYLYNLNKLQEYESEMLALGHEGIIIRQPDSPYKCGRSTEREGYLVKLKRFKDAEAEVIGFEEQMENTNELKKDELGHAKRSTHKEGMIGKNTLGKFVVKSEFGVFRIGTGVGLTDKLRKTIWCNQHRYLGRGITYKYQEIGTKNLPRCPIFKGFREDM